MVRTVQQFSHFSTSDICNTTSRFILVESQINKSSIFLDMHKLLIRSCDFNTSLFEKKTFIQKIFSDN